MGRWQGLSTVYWAGPHWAWLHGPLVPPSGTETSTVPRVPWSPSPPPSCCVLLELGVCYFKQFYIRHVPRRRAASSSSRWISAALAHGAAEARPPSAPALLCSGREGVSPGRSLLAACTLPSSFHVSPKRLTSTSVASNPKARFCFGAVLCSLPGDCSQSHKDTPARQRAARGLQGDFMPDWAMCPRTRAGGAAQQGRAWCETLDPCLGSPSKPGASSPPCGAPWWAPWGSADLSRRFGRGQSTVCCCLAGNAAVLADAKHPDVNKADCALRAPEMRSRQRSSPQRADSRFSLSRRRAAVRSTECMLQAPLLLQEEAR